LITIDNISSPKYNTPSNNTIDVVLHTIEMGNIPCTLSSIDDNQYTLVTSNGNLIVKNLDLFNQVANNEFGNVVPFSIDISKIKSQAYSKITDSCDSITVQLIPSQTKQLAYQNALMILAQNGGNPPSNGAVSTLFNNLSLTWGMNSNSFATMITNLQNLSLSLATLENSVQYQINNMTSANQILATINSYESQIDTVIGTINAMVPLPINRPNRITIQGLN
jgi:hypothetical protein